MTLADTWRKVAWWWKQLEQQWKGILAGFALGFHFYYLFWGVGVTFMMSLFWSVHPANVWASVPNPDPSLVQYFIQTYLHSIVHPARGQLRNIILAVIWATFGAIYNWRYTIHNKISKRFVVGTVVALLLLIVTSVIIGEVLL